MFVLVRTGGLCKIDQEQMAGLESAVFCQIDNQHPAADFRKNHQCQCDLQFQGQTIGNVIVLLQCQTDYTYKLEPCTLTSTCA